MVMAFVMVVATTTKKVPQGRDNTALAGPGRRLIIEWTTGL